MLNAKYNTFLTNNHDASWQAARDFLRLNLARNRGPGGVSSLAEILDLADFEVLGADVDALCSWQNSPVVPISHAKASQWMARFGD